MKKINLAILGAGGLAKAVIRILKFKKEVRLTGICDKDGYAFRTDGLPLSAILKTKSGSSIANLPKYGKLSQNSIYDLMKHKNKIDAIFVALPNMPNEFIPNIVKKIVDSGYKGIFVDVLKRTTATAILLKMDALLRNKKCVYIVGCGATPGLMSASAVLASQSFVKIDKVKIRWGVGISNWKQYKATIREDIAHLPGYNVNKAKAMTDEQVEKLLSKTRGILTFEKMEHADDILLKKAGVVDSLSQVTVGGVMDTRHAKKPVSTTMTLTGKTHEGRTSCHKFILGDETTMADNVCGTALGYLKRAVWLKNRKIFGVFGSTEFMPMVVK